MSGINNGDMNINNLRYTDDTYLITSNTKDLQILLKG